MLIERLDINDIVTVKLVSGEEIVGRLADRNADSITLSKPVQISLQPVGNNQVGLAFMPVLGSVPETSSIQIPMISMAIRPIKTGSDVSRNYIQATSTIMTATPAQTSIIAP